MPLNDPILDATLNHIDLEAIKCEMGPPPWSRSIVLADHVRGVVIYQYSGQENDNHCHNYDEWWVVLEGEIDWSIEGREDQPVEAKAGDFVFVPAQTFHHIFPKGGKPSVRLGIALNGQGHLHECTDRKACITIQ